MQSPKTWAHCHPHYIAYKTSVNWDNQGGAWTEPGPRVLARKPQMGLVHVLTKWQRLLIQERRQRQLRCQCDHDGGHASKDLILSHK
jgi:hypothetical protein